MAIIRQAEAGRLYMGKLGHGLDLLEEITAVCERENIRLGRVEAIGAVKSARIGYYDQEAREYRFLTLDQPLEILSLIGNVSLRDGRPMVHAHITLADASGKAWGGHLAPGTVIFACEITLEAFEGPRLERAFDDETGLPLWTMPE
ncbi:MAG: DNA-binding protein [Deltaproteobacteria bacterium]|nr:MAG: DNA-binding protein [Deltaproteobacteria bacterium]